MSVWKMTPVPVEFKDAKGSEGDVANLLRGPLIENKPKNRVFIKLKVRVEASPKLPSDRAVTDVVEVIIIVIAKDACPVLPAASVIRGPTV